ncbi:MAG: NUDIX hydrolase [Pseudomonadota bacterium]
MEILTMEKVTDFRHLNLFSLTYKSRSGTPKSWIFASRSEHPVITRDSVDMPDAVVIVPFHRDLQRLVIIREFRVPLGGYQYGFPAGLVDKGETTRQTAARELREETGLTLLRVVKQSPPVYSSSGMTDESVSMVFVECCGEPSVAGNEDSEDIQVILVSPEEAGRLLDVPGARFDVKSWIVLSMFSEHGKL